MTRLPRVKDRESWRSRVEAKTRAKKNASHEQRMFVIATANQIRSELRQQRKQGSASS